ncbi:MAG TPA: hypothetical protein VM510_14380, partial [Caulifigura sp.]|nr:hypothetical protein [Caulifigura sp.]
MWKSVAAPRRLAIVRSIETLGMEADPDFDSLTRIAAASFSAPWAMICLVDLDRLWVKSRHGLNGREEPAS